MTNNSLFQPDWVSPPGETISGVLYEKDISQQKFAEMMGSTLGQVKKLLNGNEPITLEIAQKLEDRLGASLAFWINRESQYREDTVRLKLEASERKEWLKKLPLRDMIKSGWVKPFSKTEEKAAECLRFFGVRNIDEWYKSYDDLLMVTAFRISSSFDSQPESVVTWLRQGEIESKSIECKPWNAAYFQETLSQIRPLTRIKDPKIFIPELRALLAKCGVALAIVPTPSRCCASGATYFVSPNKALLLLSFRYRSDDHFWFSLFHEAGHILLHGNKSIFLEATDKSSTKEEEEANNFAAEILIPNEFQSELKNLKANNWRQIIRFAKKIGVSPGIIVGQLQHSNIINHNQLNKLKTRFKWLENKSEF